MPHNIEIYSAGCPMCQEVINTITVGKCAGCEMMVYDLNSNSQSVRESIERYGIRVAPTIVIDGKIKVEGVPNFGFMCSEEFYSWLEQNFSMKR